MATPQWYQTPDIVTASIKLKGIPPDKISDITARFGEQYCALYVGGESPDEPMLTHSALPPFFPFGPFSSVRSPSLCYCIWISYWCKPVSTIIGTRWFIRNWHIRFCHGCIFYLFFANFGTKCTLCSIDHMPIFQKWYVGHSIEQRVHFVPFLAYQNEPCLVNFGFQNVSVLVQKHTSPPSLPQSLPPSLPPSLPQTQCTGSAT